RLARSINRKWIRQRTLSELLRSWAHLAIVFPLRIHSSEEDPQQAIQAARSRIQKDVLESGRVSLWQRIWRPPSGNISYENTSTKQSLHMNIVEYWTGLKSVCERTGLKQPLKEGDLALYVRERPIYQLSFFVGHQQRLQIAHTDREHS